MRIDTKEGLEVTHALEYYGRMLFTLQLLPLLRASPLGGRVLTVLAGSMLANKLDADDLNLDGPGKFGGMQTQAHMLIMNTLFFDRLSADPENRGVTFIHNWPGAVNTGNMARYHTPSTWSPAPLTSLLKPLFWFIGFSDKETRERHAYIATSGSFGGRGPRLEGAAAAKNTAGGTEGGLYLVNHKCDVKYNEQALKELRKDAQGKVWDKTMEILRPYS